jgi:rubrerythrin
MSDHTGFHQIVATALEMEGKGRRFYAEQIGKCGNKLTIELFQKLHDDEIEHVRRIKKIVESLDAGVGLSEVDFSDPADADLRGFFNGLAKNHGAKVDDQTVDVEAVEIGIDFEAKAVAFYQDRLAGTTDPAERKFLHAMVVEERGHHATLADLRFYLTDPEGYFAEFERSGLDGA